jgi:hypothetical protein
VNFNATPRAVHSSVSARCDVSEVSFTPWLDPRRSGSRSGGTRAALQKGIVKTTQLALSSLLFAACASDPSSAPAGFEKATDTQLQRTAMSAMSVDAVFVSFLALGYASAPDGAEGCPKIATEGGRRHVTGGCTTSDNQRIDGEVFLENIPGLFDPTSADPSKPQRIEARGLVLSGGEGGAIKVDGTISGDASSMIVDLDFELLGINVHSDTSILCPGGACEYEHATIDVGGLGSATVEGTFSFDSSGDIALLVNGADTLSIANEGECLAVAVGSREKTFCNDASGVTSLELIPDFMSKHSTLTRQASRLNLQAGSRVAQQTARQASLLTDRLVQQTARQASLLTDRPVKASQTGIDVKPAH